MNQHLAKIAEVLDSAELVDNLIRSKEGILIVRASNAAFDSSDQANAAAKLFKAAPKLLEVARLVLSATQNRSDRDYQLMHIDLSEAAEIARAAIREATE